MRDFSSLMRPSDNSISATNHLLVIKIVKQNYADNHSFINCNMNKYDET